MQTPVHVEILDRTYTLRVAEENVERTRTVADKVDRRMRAFQQNHPEQAKLTTAIITALALAEDLQDGREARERSADALESDLRTLTHTLEGALADEEDVGSVTSSNASPDEENSSAGPPPA